MQVLVIIQKKHYRDWINYVQKHVERLVSLEMLHLP